MQLEVDQRELNGQPALVFYRDDQPLAAEIQRIFFHADPSRLRRLGGRRG